MQTNGLFTIPIRVYIEDTDAGGIVFYANYLKYFERARTEFFRHYDYQLRQCLADNINFVVHSLNIQYKQSARLDDQLRVSAQVLKLGKTYILFEQKVFNPAGETLVAAEVKIACLSFDSARPRALPADLIESFNRSIQS